MSRETNNRTRKSTGNAIGLIRPIFRNGQGRKVLALMVMAGMLLSAMLPGVSLAAESMTLQFASYSDSTLSTGVAKTFFFNVYREDYSGLTGGLKARITHPDGKITEHPVTGAANPYTITDVALNSAGTYTLMVMDAQGNTASGILNVVDPAVRTFISGTLALDTWSTFAVKLTDLYGNDLAKKAVTIDGSGVGANPAVQNFTTLNDGTFTFSMTPSQEGLVKIIYSGDVVKTIALTTTAAVTPGTRIGGLSRNNSGLSVSVARAGWESADNVILTRNDLLSDAMVAVPLAKKLNAPVLMTSPDALDPAVLAQIQALSAHTVYIIGGTAAVSAQAEADLRTNGFETERVAGIDRYATAAAIAQRMGASDTVYLAYGYGEPDALAASAPAALRGIPILLTDLNEVPQATAEVLNSLNPADIKLLGGTAVISRSLEDRLSQKYAVERWGGSDRYATEQIILEKTFIADSPVYFTSALVTPSDVNGRIPYGDALVTAALAAKNNGFVVSLPPEEAGFSLSAAPYYFLLMNKNLISGANVVGNNEAVSPLLEDRLIRLLAG